MSGTIYRGYLISLVSGGFYEIRSKDGVWLATRSTEERALGWVDDAVDGTDAHKFEQKKEDEAMRGFCVVVARTVVEWAMVEVKADDEETAKVLAVEAAHDAAKFEWDWVSSDFAPADTEVEELEDDEEDDEPAPSAA